MYINQNRYNNNNMKITSKIKKKIYLVWVWSKQKQIDNMKTGNDYTLNVYVQLALL